MSPGRGDSKGRYEHTFSRPFRALFNAEAIRGLRFACPPASRDLRRGYCLWPLPGPVPAFFHTFFASWRQIM